MKTYQVSIKYEGVVALEIEAGNLEEAKSEAYSEFKRISPVRLRNSLCSFDATYILESPDYDFDEFCPHCGHLNKVKWDGTSRVGECEKCHAPLLYCSICDAENCGNCKWEK